MLSFLLLVLRLRLHGHHLLLVIIELSTGLCRRRARCCYTTKTLIRVVVGELMQATMVQAVARVTIVMLVIALQLRYLLNAKRTHATFSLHIATIVRFVRNGSLLGLHGRLGLLTNEIVLLQATASLLGLGVVS